LHNEQLLEETSEPCVLCAITILFPTDKKTEGDGGEDLYTNSLSPLAYHIGKKKKCVNRVPRLCAAADKK
jgi:hypothetical protein